MLVTGALSGVNRHLFTLNLDSLRAKKLQKLKDFALSRGQTEHLIRRWETPWGPAKLSSFQILPLSS